MTLRLIAGKEAIGEDAGAHAAPSRSDRAAITGRRVVGDYAVIGSDSPESRPTIPIRAAVHKLAAIERDLLIGGEQPHLVIRIVLFRVKNRAAKIRLACRRIDRTNGQATGRRVLKRDLFANVVVPVHDEYR